MKLNALTTRAVKKTTTTTRTTTASKGLQVRSGVKAGGNVYLVAY